VKYTKRYKLGQLIGGRARHLLLMTATPHNGNDADFELFMGLLDADRFEGRPREGARKVDLSDLMRRLTKEELRKFNGAPLFPERNRPFRGGRREVPSANSNSRRKVGKTKRRRQRRRRRPSSPS
jgi:hypothetical protein